MGQAKRRKQQLGDLYGTPEGSSLMRTSIAPVTVQRLQALGAIASGRNVEGDPFWEWLSLEIRRIAGDLVDDLLDKAVRIVVAAMGLHGDEAMLAEGILWVLASHEVRGSLEDHAARLQHEITHCDADPQSYLPSGL